MAAMIENVGPVRRTCLCHHAPRLARLTVGAVVAVFGAAYRLSPAETEILHLAAHGLATKEIAAIRECSPKTVEALWSRVYGKTRLPSQREVMAGILQHAVESVIALHPSIG
jgi:DNA-binding CsgD family transcriptional regulator